MYFEHHGSWSPQICTDYCNNKLIFVGVGFCLYMYKFSYCRMWIVYSTCTCTVQCTLWYQESITVGGVYSRETSNDICAWAVYTVLLIAVLLLRRVTYKMAACTKRRWVTTQWTLNGALMTPRVVRRISSRLIVTFFAITIDALAQLAAFTRAQ